MHYACAIVLIVVTTLLCARYLILTNLCGHLRYHTIPNTPLLTYTGSLTIIEPHREAYMASNVPYSGKF